MSNDHIHPVMQSAIDMLHIQNEGFQREAQLQRELDATKRKLERLLSILNNYADMVDGSDGEPEPNMAMGILVEYDGWLQGWIK